jgi:pimeloyl-ACP methyl ester carboxylesterase
VLTIPELADTVIAWLDARQLASAALVGNSLGCQVIAEAAVRHPRRVSHAVLIGPSMDPQARTAARQVAGLIRIALREPLSLSGIAVLDYLRCGPWRLWRTFQYGLAHPMADQLRRVLCPALIIRGEHDLLSTARWCDEATRLLPNGRLVTIASAAHAVHYSHPADVATVVNSFLDELPPSRSERRFLTRASGL